MEPRCRGDQDSQSGLYVGCGVYEGKTRSPILCHCPRQVQSAHPDFHPTCCQRALGTSMLGAACLAYPAVSASCFSQNSGTGGERALNVVCNQYNVDCKGRVITKLASKCLWATVCQEANKCNTKLLPPTHPLQLNQTARMPCFNY